MFSGLESPTHLLIVLLIAIIVLGPKRLPQVGRSLGSGIRHFKAAIEGKDEGKGDEPAEPLAPRRRLAVRMWSIRPARQSADRPRRGRALEAFGPPQPRSSGAIVSPARSSCSQ